MCASLYWEYNGPELKDTKGILARSMFIPNKGVVNQSFLPEDIGEMITALLCFREDVDFSSFTKKKSIKGHNVEGSLPRKAAALQLAWNEYFSLEICPWGTALQMGCWDGWVFFLSQYFCFYIPVLSRFLFLIDGGKLIWWSASLHAGCCADGICDFQVSQLQLLWWVWITFCQPPPCPWEHTGPILSSTSLYSLASLCRVCKHFTLRWHLPCCTHDFSSILCLTFQDRVILGSNSAYLYVGPPAERTEEDLSRYDYDFFQSELAAAEGFSVDKLGKHHCLGTGWCSSVGTGVLSHPGSCAHTFKICLIILQFACCSCWGLEAV